MGTVRATEGPFDLAEAKLAPPLARPGTVAKSRLITELSESPCSLATVVAPAGYGKTTLLASWAEADARSFAWVAVDGRDDDLVVFLRYVATAVHRVEPLSADVFDALAGPGRSAWPTLVLPLGRALRRLRDPLVLVLDDLHAITNRACLDALAELCRYVPAGSLLALVSREKPALPVARWRAEQLVYEVEVGDLQLDERESAGLLTAAGVELADEQIAGLTERTEGWPAGLFLAALSLQAGAPSLADAGRLSGDDRYISEYFRLELLDRLPEAETRFLLGTAVLDRISGDLCDAVLEREDSAATIAELARTNCFVVPLDRRGEWYRYHHLFAELLRSELERNEPDLARELSRRAMAWCLEHDLPEAALAYAHAAGEVPTVASLVDSLGHDVYWDGRLETLEEWIAWFSEDELRRYPAVAVSGAWVRAVTGRRAEARRLLALADGATSAIPLSDGSESIGPWVATLRACMMPDGAELALADAELALDGLAADSVWRVTGRLIRGTAHALLGDYALAGEDLAATVELGTAVSAVDDTYLAHAELALLAARLGAWAEAGRNARKAQALVDDNGFGDYSTSAIVHVATARVAIHDTRLGDAREALTRTHRLRPLLDANFPWITLQVGLELIRAHLTLAEPGPARTVLGETERFLEGRQRMGLLVDEVAELRERVAATSGPDGTWAMSLTAAELRLLPYLATHLTFPGIGERLFISRNTVKSEAVAIYRKLGVSSRSDAIERAIEVGLLEGSIYPPPVNLIPEG